MLFRSIGLGRAMSRLSVSTYVEFHQATNYPFDPYMPIVVVDALLGGIVLAIIFRGIHSLSGELALPDLSVMSQSWRLPCPQTSESTSRSHAGPFRGRPMTGTLIRATGVRFHIVRTLFSLPGLACYILACLVSR